MRLLLPAILFAMIGAPVMSAGFVAVQGSRLMLGDREYRAIGANMPNLSGAFLGTWFHTAEKYGNAAGAREAMLAGLHDASESGLRFIRFFADPGYPRDRAMLYDRDPEAYWRGMDELVQTCAELNLKLIPSLGTIPGPYGIFGEAGQAILDPDSLTYEAVHRYIREFVTRYRDDPTILMWELVNEAMLGADVEMEGRKLLPAGVYPPGANPRVDGTNGDSLSFAMIQQLYREQTAYIKSLDPNHPVTSGDAAVRPECTSRRETFPDFRFRRDTWREWLGNNLLSQPEPLDVFSFHFYGHFGAEEGQEAWGGQEPLDAMRRLVRAAHAAEAPVLIGELGAQPDNRADEGNAWVRAAIDAMEQEGTSLMTLWVWHFTWQPGFTLDSASAPELVSRARAFNERWAPLEP